MKEANPMKTIELLDAVRARYDVSDYKAASLLGVRPTTVSSYRTGRSHFDDEVCLRVAELLDLPPQEVLAAVAAERTKCPRAAAIWRQVSIAARSTAGAVILGIALSFWHVPQAQAHQVSLSPVRIDCILWKITRAMVRAVAGWLRGVVRGTPNGARQPINGALAMA